jgi:hypothetical protein
VGRLKDAGLIAACGFMLNTTEFRDAACDVIRQVAGVHASSSVYVCLMCAIASAMLAMCPASWQACCLVSFATHASGHLVELSRRCVRKI